MSRRKILISGLCLGCVLIVLGVGIVCWSFNNFGETDNSIKNYETYTYKMEYNSLLCFPTLINTGGCEKNSGEIWQFYGFEEKDMYVDSYVNDEEKIEKSRIPMGKPFLIVIDGEMPRINGKKYKEYKNVEEALKEAEKYYTYLIKNGGNEIINSENIGDEIVLSLKDGAKAKIKVLQTEVNIDLPQYQWESIYCQYTKDNEKLNKSLEKMYNSFERNEEGNILLEEGDKEKIDSLTKYTSGYGTHVVIDKENKEFDEYEYQKLLNLPMSEIDKEHYESGIKNEKYYNEINLYWLDGKTEKFKISYKNDSSTYGFVKYKGKYYVVTATFD